ncbi:MAG: tetraprenyl-beta-curcumene synthase family protein [Thermaerobacterales bacterium]
MGTIRRAMQAYPQVEKLWYGGRLLRQVLPLVNQELLGWRARARAIPHAEFRRQALDSIHFKHFHCEGGSVYACLLDCPGERAGLVRAIVALQTISDYLDNLSDRWTQAQASVARHLHGAMLDAVTPWQPASAYFPPGEHDGGYLNELVAAVRHEVLKLPGYRTAFPYVYWLASRYSDLQVLKHLEPARRQPLLKAWFERHAGDSAGQVSWWEFSAATGSTLGMFALMTAAVDERLSPGAAARIHRSYFPWICGLHILLDYFIDQEEDRIGGDLNFAACYSDPKAAAQGLGVMLDKSFERAAELPDPVFHSLLVQGLPGLYLADAKVKRQGLEPYARRLLAAAGPAGRVVYRISLWRRWLLGEKTLLQPPPAGPAGGKDAAVRRRS